MMESQNLAIDRHAAQSDTFSYINCTRLSYKHKKQYYIFCINEVIIYIQKGFLYNFVCVEVNFVYTS